MQLCRAKAVCKLSLGKKEQISRLHSQALQHYVEKQNEIVTDENRVPLIAGLSFFTQRKNRIYLQIQDIELIPVQLEKYTDRYL